MNSSNFFELGQLAEASYANLWDAATAQPIILRDDVKLALVARNFSDAQASAFVDAWSVITHQPDTASSFSATLFQNQETGRYALAIRGTAGLLDLLEDVSNIVADGLAMDQIVDLYNFWKWVTTPAGQSYQVARLVDLAEGGDPSKVLVERFGGYSTIQFESSSTVYSAIDQYATGLGKTDIAVNGLDVTGHSLGGHLAAAFTRLFPALGAAATTINGAGFATAGPFGGVSGTAQINIENLFGMLGGVGSFGAVQNIYGDKMPEVITQDGPVLYQQGMHDELFIEQDGFFDNTLGHGSSQMTDSLAVYDLFIELDGSLQSSTPQAALAKLKPLFESGSSNASRSLETLVNALADLFDTGTRIGDAQTDNREALYLAINKIKTDADFTRTQGLLTVQPFAALSRDQLVAKAQLDGAEGLAYRYAIANLSPFAIGGDAALYSPHNAAGELDLYNPATGQGELTERYLRDRAAMLAWQNQFNANDTQPVGDTFVKLQGGTPFYFEDFTNNAITTKMRIGGGDSVNAVMSRPLGDFNLIVFGSENNDALTGQGKGDRFYGGAGADTLTGKGGNDYLEGGAGFDTYVINAGDGHDTLLDTDGQGLIEIGGVYAQGSATDELEPGQWKRLGPHAWTDTLHGITYTRIIHEGETRLLIKRGDASVLVRGWSDGQLGIELGAGAAVALPGLATSFHLEGDLQPVAPHAASGYDSYGNAFVTAEAAPDRADVLYDHETDDHLQGHGGNDLLIAQHGGHDLLEGGAGFDFLMGGTGNDQLFGETRIDDLAAYLLAAETQAGTGEVGDWLSGWDGSDILVGGAGNDVLVGGKGEDLMIAGAGNDLVYGDFEHTVTPNPDGSTTYYMPGQLATEGAADVIYGNAGDDQLHGNQGNDILDGGAHHDTLYGEAGDDVLLGGEGSDKLYGDGNGTLPEDEGNDYLDGGPGIDYLAGGGGNDTYVNVTGEDTLFDNQGHNTVFVLANEVDPAGLAASVQTNAAGQSFMQVQIALDSVGALRVDDPFAATGTTTLEFANGEALDLETLIGERLFTPLNLNLGGSGGRAYGGAGNDTLRGGMGDDTLLGYAGDDMLSGKDGADTLEGGAGGDYLSGGASDDVLDGGAGDDTLDGGAGDDTLQAGAGDDSLYGGEGADTLLGADGNDELWGDEGADILEGGAGDDYLSGGTGDDVYRLDTGSGWDTIDDTEGCNSIEFAAGIGLESLSLSRGVHDYEIAYGDGWDGVSVSSAWALSPTELKFADGTYVLSNELFTGIPVPVWGDEEDNVLAGLGPGVEFWGGWGGDDTLIGGAGDNVYDFELGDGSDAIVDLGGVDTLSFGEGITPDDLYVEYGDLGNQLPGFRIYVGPYGDAVSIQGGESGVLEKFQFSDGLTLTFDEVLAWQGGLHVVPGSTTGDRHGERLVVGTDGEDELDDSGVQFSSDSYGVAYLGGLGNDAITAAVRTDSQFLLNQGDGNDTIRRAEIDADEGPDALVFGAGIMPESLSFSFVERTVTGYSPFIGMTTYTVTDAVIQYGGAGDSVTMQGDSLADLNFMFADGRVATYSSLTSGVTVVTGGGRPGSV